MNDELTQYLISLIQKAKYGEIELKGDFQHEDIKEMLDKFDELNLVGVTLDLSCVGYGTLKVFFDRGGFIL